MLEHHFWENFRKWIPHPEVDEVYDVEEIGFKEDGFVVLLRPDHFQEEKRSERALRLVWDRIVSYTVTDSDHLTRFREENYIVPEDTHHFFICGTNLMADILSDEYPTATFLKWGPEIR